MLESMRKHAKYFYVLFAIIIVAFIFTFTPQVDRSSSLAVAEIGKDRITIDEYSKAYNMERENLRRQYKEKFDEEFEKKIMLKQRVLNQMINEKILLIAAKEMGISVSDEELAEAIMNTPAFKRDGVFDKDLYLIRMEIMKITENDIRQEMIVKKVQMLISEAVDLSDYELKKIPGDEKTRDITKKILLSNKKYQAIISFIEGKKKQLNIKINTDMLSY